MVEAGEFVHDKISNQQAASETTSIQLRMAEGTQLREHLDQLNTLLLELRNIDVKIEDEDAALILLVSLPMSFENFVQSFIVGKDTASLEEVRSAPHRRELRHMANGTSTDIQPSGLFTSSGK